jgi:putative endonuclease
MLNNKKSIGNLGEDLSCRIIAERKYSVIKRNYRNKFGEIDIIAREKGGQLVFFEVKTLTNKNVCQLDPEDNLTQAKLQKLRRICLWFANQHPELIDLEKGWRIDLLALSLDGGICRYKHYKNIG